MRIFTWLFGQSEPEPIYSGRPLSHWRHDPCEIGSLEYFWRWTLDLPPQYGESRCLIISLRKFEPGSSAGNSLRRKGGLTGRWPMHGSAAGGRDGSKLARTSGQLEPLVRVPFSVHARRHLSNVVARARGASYSLATLQIQHSEESQKVGRDFGQNLLR